MENITQKLVKELFDYNQETGLFVRKKSKRKIKRNINKYKTWNISKIPYLEHRLIWLWMTGEWPFQVDHINHKKGDNRWKNLRNSTNQENQKNTKISKNNKSGIVGVSFRSDIKKWRSYIMVDFKQISLGVFSCFGQAVKIRKEAEIQYGFHKNHGKYL